MRSPGVVGSYQGRLTRDCSPLKHALELRKPALYLNVGPTRADGMPGVEKLEIPTGEVMRDVAHRVL